MPRSTVSKLCAASLLGLSLLASGCGERAQHYTPGEVAAAFRAAFASTGSFAPLGDFDVLPSGPQRARPVDDVLGSVAHSFGLRPIRQPVRVTLFSGAGVGVYVYALDSAARHQQFQLNDLLAANRVLGRESNFAVVRQGNIVVTYRILSSRLPFGLRDAPIDPRRFFADVKRRVDLALARLR